MKKYFSSILLFLFCLTVTVTAQSNTEKEVLSLFRSKKKMEWVKYYKGRVDDINDVSVVLAYDGRDCKGFITYLRSKQKFKLEGSLDGTKIQLRETDSEESVVGHLQGKISENKRNVSVRWFNVDKTRAAEVIMTQVRKEAVLPSYCGDDKWARTYQGKIRNKSVEFVLQKDDLTLLNGTIFFQEENRSYSLRGRKTSSSKFKCEALDHRGVKQGTLEGEINEMDLSITGYWKDNGGKQFRIKFEKSHNLTTGCVEFQDYMMSYDVTYPKSKSKALNQFIDEKVEAWKKDCKEYLNVLKTEYPNPGPNERAMAAASAWYRLEYMNESFASGFLTMDNSWGDNLEDYSFNFDLENNKAISLGDFFKSNMDYKKILRKKAINQIQFKDIYKNESFREWLAGTEFVHFTLRPNGLQYSTAYHPIYGRQSVLISFIELSEYLKEKHPLAMDSNPLK